MGNMDYSNGGAVTGVTCLVTFTPEADLLFFTSSKITPIHDLQRTDAASHHDTVVTGKPGAELPV